MKKVAVSGLEIYDSKGRCYDEEQIAAYFAYINGSPPPEGWMLLPEDLWTHFADWRTAVYELVMTTAAVDDRAYWQHQLNTLERIEAMMKGSAK